MAIGLVAAFSKIKKVIQTSDTRGGRAFDYLVIALIIYSMITLSIETIPGLSEAVYRYLIYSEIVITTIFTIEYILRIVTAQKKWSYILSFYGIIDFLAVAPFYLFIGLDLRGVRAFRLFRLFRLLKLARYTTALERFRKALILAREEVVIFLGATSVLLYLSAIGIYYFENQAQPEHFQSIPHSLWWAVATLTTVGYGDVYPVTLGGKVFTFIILMIGLGIVAVPAGILASALAKIRRDMEES
jgi:voltage-gated potassium channel